MPSNEQSVKRSVSGSGSFINSVPSTFTRHVTNVPSPSPAPMLICLPWSDQKERVYHPRSSVAAHLL